MAVAVAERPPRVPEPAAERLGEAVPRYPAAVVVAVVMV